MELKIRNGDGNENSKKATGSDWIQIVQLKEQTPITKRTYFKEDSLLNILTCLIFRLVSPSRFEVSM